VKETYFMKNTLNGKKEFLLFDFQQNLLFTPFICLFWGRAMAQVVSHQPLTMEAQVHARVNSCGIFGGQSGTGTGFSLSSSVFPSVYHSTVVLQTHIIWGMRNMLT
jgi:hypothetical protein